MELVFVYGTLKQGFNNNCLLYDSVYVGPAVTKHQYAMYSDGIPYVTEKLPLTNIIGELYEVDKHSLYNLDMLEGHPKWYKRKQIDIVTLKSYKGSNAVPGVWLYFNDYIPSTATLNTTGNYLKY